MTKIEENRTCFNLAIFSFYLLYDFDDFVKSSRKVITHILKPQQNAEIGNSSEISTIF